MLKTLILKKLMQKKLLRRMHFMKRDLCLRWVAFDWRESCSKIFD
jgi:hypothetical protein